jgi:hypothetical protein
MGNFGVNVIVLIILTGLINFFLFIYASDYIEPILLKNLIFIISFIPIIYVWTRKFKEIFPKGKKEVKEKRYYKIYYSYYFGWLRKNWYLIILTTPILFTYYQIINKQPIGIFGGFSLILYGIITLIATYKKMSFVIDHPRYKIGKEMGYEKKCQESSL